MRCRYCPYFTKEEKWGSENTGDFTQDQPCVRDREGLSLLVFISHCLRWVRQYDLVNIQLRQQVIWEECYILSDFNHIGFALLEAFWKTPSIKVK